MELKSLETWVAQRMGYFCLSGGILKGVSRLSPLITCTARLWASRSCEVNVGNRNTKTNSFHERIFWSIFKGFEREARNWREIAVTENKQRAVLFIAYQRESGI